ncbi:hypothetical protein [Roseobacter sinensis]|uniref:Phytanoyl-CoA dioxygenase n=1 Tax=Roseobacter sinensis TaxID=2931391 RepID=A0ABT3BCE6_9RHOB|nr:hypothetical protein [Roseobacter sp. WL0113]MCV3271232.1 hypothetical protein [Roseobacter sp. WL0113]
MALDRTDGDPSAFSETGWAVFPPEDAVLDWVTHALPHARAAVSAEQNAAMLQCEGTWFVGLDVLPNDVAGRVAGGPALTGSAVAFTAAHCGGWPALHPAQLSVTYPGYPRPREGESAAGFRYRLNRNAAHVDGLIGVGDPKRRFVREPHAFILGLPMTDASEAAAPLVVWPGSHAVMQAALREALGPATGPLSQVDVTDAYTAARRRVFESCPRIVVHAPVGAVILLHRMVLHGVAPWGETATAGPDGRMIAYFRPPMAGGVEAWLEAR